MFNTGFAGVFSPFVALLVDPSFKVLWNCHWASKRLDSATWESPLLPQHGADAIWGIVPGSLKSSQEPLQTEHLVDRFASCRRIAFAGEIRIVKFFRLYSGDSKRAPCEFIKNNFKKLHSHRTLLLWKKKVDGAPGHMFFSLLLFSLVLEGRRHHAVALLELQPPLRLRREKSAWESDHQGKLLHAVKPAHHQGQVRSLSCHVMVLLWLRSQFCPSTLLF